MSESPPPKLNILPKELHVQSESNKHTKSRFSNHQHARDFVTWYKHMVDNERHNLGLYISDNAVLEWFGKTIKTKKKVSLFLRFDMECSKHDFRSVESIDKIQSRYDEIPNSKEDCSVHPLASPLNELHSKTVNNSKKRPFSSDCSPDWADECQNQEKKPDNKRLKTSHNEPEKQYVKFSDMKLDMVGLNVNNNGDGIVNRRKQKYVLDTPPYKELGQGDCLPSTSGTDSEKSHDTLNAQLPKLAVECNGYIQFMRTKNNREIDAMKWERKCKVQISYSHDPLNVGEYVIWALRYSDESKCRRNLLAAFEESDK